METNMNEVAGDMGGLTDERWTPAEQAAFSAWSIGAFPNESSQGLISLGSAWKRGQAYADALLATKAAAAEPVGEPRFNSIGIAESWSVTVEAEGRLVLQITDESYLGLPDLEQYEETIKASAAHLLGFIGAAQPAEAAPAAPEQAVPEGWKLDAERKFLEDWLQLAAEPVGLECCGHAHGDECCGNPDAVPMRPSELIKVMQDRHTQVLNLLAAAPVPPVPAPAPIQMILHCPKCGLQHIDAPDERTEGWVNPPHRSHLCHGCGHIWRPADVPTEGVKAIQTRGKNDSAPAEAEQQEFDSLFYPPKALLEREDWDPLTRKPKVPAPQPSTSVPRVDGNTSIKTWQERSAGPDGLGLYPDAFFCMQEEIADLRTHVARQAQVAPDACARFEAWWHEGPHPYRDVGGKKKPLLDEKSAWHVWQVAQAERAAVPEVLFDGKAVYDEVMANDPHTPRPTADNIADVLDAVVRLMRRSAPVAQEGGRQLGPKTTETRMDTGLEAGREVAQEVEPSSVRALRYTSDGALAECPCCGSLDVGGAHDTVHCYRCGLMVKAPRPLQHAIDKWNRRAGAAPSSTPAAAQAAPTDLSKRLREAVQQFGKLGSVTLFPSHVIAAADEIDRYYGGMLAWKRTAESDAGNMIRIIDALGLELTRADTGTVIEAIQRLQAAAQAAPADRLDEALAIFLAEHTRLNQDGIDTHSMKLSLALNYAALNPVPESEFAEWRAQGYLTEPAAAPAEQRDAASAQAAPDEVRNQALRYRFLRSKMLFSGGKDEPATMTMRVAFPAPEHNFHADWVSDRFDASVGSTLDAAMRSEEAEDDKDD